MNNWKTSLKKLISSFLIDPLIKFLNKDCTKTKFCEKEKLKMKQPMGNPANNGKLRCVKLKKEQGLIFRESNCFEVD